MLLLSYDITNNKTRTRFNKFIKKHGRRLQFSVYEIKNSPRIIKLVMTEIEMKYSKMFKKTDSVLIFHICDGCYKKIKRYGYAVNEEEEVLMFD